MNPTALRAIHRWLMTVFSLPLMYLVLSGTVLATYDLLDGNEEWVESFGGAEKPRPAAPPLQRDSVAMAVASSIAALHSYAPAAVPTRLRVDSGTDGMQTILSTAGPDPRTLAIDVSQSRVVSDRDSVQGRQWSAHVLIKNWHRGSVAGVAGLGLTLLSGLALFILVISGVWLYFRLWYQRRESGHAAFFWRQGKSTRLVMRWAHRWLAILAAVLLLNTSITGVLLAADEAMTELHSKGRGRPPEPVPLPLPADFGTQVLRAYDLANAAATQRKLTTIGLEHMPDGTLRGSARYDGHRDEFPFDVATATTVVDRMAPPRFDYQGPIAYHQWLKRLHRGDWIGSFYGRYLSLITASALFFLLVSGVWMYFDVRRVRSRSAKSDWFWE